MCFLVFYVLNVFGCGSGGFVSNIVVVVVVVSVGGVCVLFAARLYNNFSFVGLLLVLLHPHQFTYCYLLFNNTNFDRLVF